MAADKGNLSSKVRCAKHGLWYDAAASGCVLCRRPGPRRARPIVFVATGACVIISMMVIAVIMRASPDPAPVLPSSGIVATSSAAAPSPNVSATAPLETQPAPPSQASFASPAPTSPAPMREIEAGAAKIPTAIASVPSGLPPLYPAGSPVRTLHLCVALIQDCIWATHQIDECAYGATRCTTKEPWRSAAGDEACCPNACIDNYRADRARGVDPGAALGNTRRSSCAGEPGR